MSTAVVLWVDYAVKPGALSAFRSLLNEMLTASEKEHGFLTQELYALGDGYSGFINERYESSEFFVEHVAEWSATFGKRFFDLAEIKRIVALGNVSSEAAELMKQWGTVVAERVQGFSK